MSTLNNAINMNSISTMPPGNSGKALWSFQDGIQFENTSGNTILVQPPASVTNYSLTLPGVVPSTSQVLYATNGTGTLGWESLSLGSSLSDVVISSPSNGQILSYNGTDWVNAAASGGGISTLTGDSGGAISPSSGNINLNGTTNQITTTGSGHSIVWSLPTVMTVPGSLTVTTGLTVTGSTTLNADTSGITMGNDSGIGAINLVTSTATSRTINIGTNTIAAVTLNIGSNFNTNMTLTIGSSNTFTLTGASGSTYVLCSAITTGSITIGGTALAGGITIAQSSATNTINIGNGSGATTLNMLNGAGSNPFAIGSTATTAPSSIKNGSGSLTIQAVGGATLIGSSSGSSSTSISAGSGGISLNAITNINSNVSLTAAGNKFLVHATTAASDSIGTATLSGGTVTVSTTAVTASSLIFCTHNTVSGTIGILSVPTASISSGTHFVINSSSGSDASTVNYWIIN